MSEVEMPVLLGQKSGVAVIEQMVEGIEVGNAADVSVELAVGKGGAGVVGGVPVGVVGGEGDAGRDCAADGEVEAVVVAIAGGAADVDGGELRVEAVAVSGAGWVGLSGIVFVDLAVVAEVVVGDGVVVDAALAGVGKRRRRHWR